MPQIGGEYWYDWSLLLPERFDHQGNFSIVMQLATFFTARNGKFPAGANGTYMGTESDRRSYFTLQRQGEAKDTEANRFTLLGEVAAVKGCWVDFLMQAKWSGCFRFSAAVAIPRAAKLIAKLKISCSAMMESKSNAPISLKTAVEGAAPPMR